MDVLEKIQNQLKSRPYDPVLLQSLGRLLLAGSNYKEAKNEFRMAVLYNPRLESEILLDYEKQIKNNAKSIGLRMSLAEFLLSLGKTDLALLELEELMEISPRLPQVYNVLGQIYIKLERIDDAIALLERAIELKVSDVFLLELLAGAYVEKGRLEDAINLYEEVLLSDPGNKKILRTLGELYTRVFKYERAADRYQVMLSDDPEVLTEVIQQLEELLLDCRESVYIREVLGDVYFRAMRPDEAVKLYREIIILDRGRKEDIISRYKRVLKAYPDHFGASLGLGEALTTKGEFSEAVKLYEFLLKKHTDSVDLVIGGLTSILESCPEQVLAHHVLAEAYLAREDVKESVAEFTLALGLDSGLADQIIKKSREILKSYPHLLIVKILLGRAFIAKGEVREAIKLAEEVNSLDKKFALGYVLLGDGYGKLGLGEKAVEAYFSALKLDPYNLDIQNKYKGKKEEDINQGIKLLRGKIIEDEWKISLHLDLGKVLFTRGKIEEALKEFQFAAKDRARAPFAYNFMGACFKETGQFDLSAAQFVKALDKLPTELKELGKVIRLNLGGVYEAQGFLMKSIAAYESVMAEDLYFEHLKDKIKELKACKLSSLRNRRLACILNNLEEKKPIAFWGRQLAANREADLSISFGQEHNNGGFDLFMKGLYEGAKEEFSLAVQIDSGFAPALNNLGAIHLLEGKLEDSQALLSEAGEKEEIPALVLNNLGVVFLLSGKYDKALKMFQEARNLGAQFSALSVNLGDACFLLGKVAEAFDYYREVQPLDVLSDFVKRRLCFRVPESSFNESK